MDTLFTTAEDALRYLGTLGSLQDQDLNVFEAALACSVQEHPGISVDKYRQHLAKMKEQVEEAYERICAEGSEEKSLQAQCEALADVLITQQGYKICEKHALDIQNNDIIRVIDRRLGNSFSFGLLAVALGRVLGWDIYGLHFPGRFLVRVDFEGARAILDPFQDFKEMHAPDLRALLKETSGEDAELSSGYYEALSNRDILLLLHNQTKHRLVEMEEYKQAVAIIDLMKRYAPDENRLLFDEGILYVRLDDAVEAVRALRAYVDTTPDGPDKWQAMDLMDEIARTIS